MNPSPLEPGDAVSPGPLRSTRHARRRAVPLAIVLASVLGISVGAVALRGQTPVEEATVASGHDVVVEVASVDTDLLPFADAWNRVDDAERPFVVTVLGDSTGNEQGEWVDRAFRTLAEELDRPLVEHPYDLTTARYGTEITSNTDADGAPLIVWNGSASGKTAAYSLANYDTLVPVQPDVVILNHGLNNVRNPDAVGGEFSDILTRTEQSWPRSVGYAAILENPRFDDWADAHTAVLERVGTWLEDRPFVLGIDAHGAYLARSDVSSLLTVDLLHPSPAGSQVTADTVLNAIARASTGDEDDAPADRTAATGGDSSTDDSDLTP
ncbi:SGNH/GDSL hydrolase family protein [Labedella endophytica]|uniref:SGNH/GDSL hydrolase family protein n=1 Tax=Labedella endophytica TaxID=1523160 RepID=A0A3S0WY23_9MICO|nr:SGNH/GDSL hydrolase family protein [Labedella endophytica]RUR00837.1 SGNH/GDSL hydrolase family protein [Labedella endophytica]